MPFEPDNPATQAVSVLIAPAVPEQRENQNKVITHFHIQKLYFNVAVDDPAATEVYIKWCGGYYDEGEFQIVWTKEITLSGIIVVEEISAIVTANNTRWLEIQAAAWKALQRSGHIPAGSVV